MSDTDVLDMAADPEERAALQALARRLEHAAGTDLAPLPPDLRARTMAAVGQAAAADRNPPAATPARPRERTRLSRWLRPGPLLGGAGLAAAVTVAALVVAGLPDGPEGKLEAETGLAGKGVSASIEVRQIGVGRVVQLDSDSLPILPKGQYYEVWFVGPGDSRRRPNRISAGTFHPDEKGGSDVELKAAVDPKLYPRMEVTAEPGDGDPRASGRAVLAGRLPLRE